MKTLLSLALLVASGVVANFVIPIVVNLAGLPGALVGGVKPPRPLARFRLGVVVAFVGQVYVALAFTAWVAAWTRLAAARSDVVGVVLWPVAFLAVAGPFWVNLIRARVEARESPHASAQVEALHLTVVTAILSFPVFALFPSFASAAWGWVPLVRAAANTRGA